VASLAENDWVTLALLLKARGNRGELLAESFTSGPERFPEGTSVTLWKEGAERRTAEVEEAWEHLGLLVLKFRGVDSIDDADGLRGYEVQVPFSERAPLAEGEYYQSDLIGCTVVDRATGKELAKVTGFEEFGAAPLLVVQTLDGREEMVPFTPAICVAVHLSDRRIDVELPEGLLDVNRA